MHIWRDDKLGNRVLRALLSAAERGVNVRVRKDLVGAVFEHSEEHRNSMFHKSPGLAARLGVCVMDCAYPDTGKRGYEKQENQLVKKFLEHTNVVFVSGEFWDHTKYWLFDDKTLYITSMNVENKHIAKDVRGFVWRDNNIKITERAVIARLKKKLSGNFSEEKDSGGTRASAGDRLVSKDIFVNTKKYFEIKKKILEMLSGAKSKVRAHVAYWGDQDITNALAACARRGVSVEIIIPQNANICNDINKATLLKLRKELMKKENKIKKENKKSERSGMNTLRIFLCKEMLHAKAFLVDDAVFLGSANFNRRGLTCVGEANYYHRGNDAFVSAVNKWMDENKKISKLVKSDAQLKHNFFRAFLER